jgi:hypothetical protein
MVIIEDTNFLSYPVKSSSARLLALVVAWDSFLPPLQRQTERYIPDILLCEMPSKSCLASL